ncbi:hypothetical protein OsI_25870 [Oryza sativa Indica Group]|uniref:Uncharacterized protein n=2 Tax=Oryza TaxID=4527 RepID=A0A0E0I026_ORYNI|nr:hypothetical protein OsI_25870 [Oryza sativa Indica Group]
MAVGGGGSVVSNETGVGNGGKVEREVTREHPAVRLISDIEAHDLDLLELVISMSRAKLTF